MCYHNGKQLALGMAIQMKYLFGLLCLLCGCCKSIEGQGVVKYEKEVGVPWVVTIPTPDGNMLKVYPHPIEEEGKPPGYVMNVITPADVAAKDGRCNGEIIYALERE
jgi:hypothetical protein